MPPNFQDRLEYLILIFALISSTYCFLATYVMQLS